MKVRRPIARSGKPIKRRLFWILATPFVSVGNRLGLCSYEWVNVCVGARRPDLFDPLWHYQRYGTPIPSLPPDVTLCGIGYSAQAHEGIVTFFNDFTKERITFERDAIEKDDLWYLELSSGHHAASHVQAAYAWVCAVFGGSFVRRAA